MPLLRPISLYPSLLLAVGSLFLTSSAHSHTSDADLVTPTPPTMHQHNTFMYFSVTGEARSTPDLLSIHLSAHSENTSPIIAQKNLNHIVDAAVQAIDKQKSIKGFAGNYTLSQEYTPHGPQLWSARQTITLSGSHKDLLLSLTEQLQTLGLGVENMEWSLAPETHERLEEQARLAALAKLKKQAEQNAQVLELQLTGFDRVQIGDASLPDSPIEPRPIFMTSLRSSTPNTSPQSTPDEQVVHVTVSAQAKLVPALIPQ